MKRMIDKKLQGKRNRASGSSFERKVRIDLEKRGWIVSKFQNNVDLENSKLIPAKRKYNPFNKALSVGTGFPDFICFRFSNIPQEVIGVEAKSNGYLDKKEKAKCYWLLRTHIFNRVLIAKKKKDGRRIIPEYIDFEEKYGGN